MTQIDAKGNTHNTPNLDDKQLNTLVVEDGEYKTFFTPKFSGYKKRELQNEKLIRAFIPGTIVEVLVKPGQLVKQGDLLLILDAMKMNNQVKSPVNATVKEVNVKVGDRVSKGVDLVVLE